jgi:cytochrome c oxidase cbb3-type subunit 4
MTMDPATLQVLWTVVSAALFAGIVIWAWSRRAAGDFAEAERMPFYDDGLVDDAGRERGR